jgi:hypothetical protein
MILPNEIVIDDDNFQRFTAPNGYGLVPRDMTAYPTGGYSTCVAYGAVKDVIPLIPYADMPELIRERVEKKMQVSDLRNIGLNGSKVPHLQQGNSNFCWAYGAVHGLMLSRIISNLPHVELSPHGVACKIYNFSNRGGWSAHAAERIAKTGCPTTKTWPMRSFSRANDNAETWAEAQLYRTTEGWIDLDSPHYDRDLSFQEVLTLLIYGIPCPVDFNWWGHAVCGMDAVDAFPSLPATDPNRYGMRILNSHPTDVAVLVKSKARPDNACGMRAPLIVT